MRRARDATAVLSPQEAARAIEAVLEARPAPWLRALLARDAVILALLAREDLPAQWLADARWSDVAWDACPGLRVKVEGLAVHVPLGEAALQLLAGWRARLAARLDRVPGPTEPVFPSFGQHRVPPDPLGPITEPMIRHVVRTRLGAVGVDRGLARLSALRGVLVGIDPAALHSERAAPVPRTRRPAWRGTASGRRRRKGLDQAAAGEAA